MLSIGFILLWQEVQNSNCFCFAVTKTQFGFPFHLMSRYLTILLKRNHLCNFFKGSFSTTSCNIFDSASNLRFLRFTVSFLGSLKADLIQLEREIPRRINLIESSMALLTQLKFFLLLDNGEDFFLLSKIF